MMMNTVHKSAALFFATTLALLATHSASAQQAAPIVKLPGQGQLLDLMVGEVIIKSSSKETKGSIAQVVLIEKPGYATTLQINNRTDISFFVLEGVLTMRIRDQVVTYPANSFVHIPKGTPHAHANLTNKPVRLFMTFLPGGYEQFFFERANATKTSKPGTPAYAKAMQALTDKYGITNIDLAPFKNLQRTR
ncbi:MAG: cupin domain-containing protein [Arenimonas sp.]